MLPVTIEDIEAANQIAPEVLGRSLDELPPQTRRLLDHIKAHVRERMEANKSEQKFARFTRRELRERTGWSETQTRMHFERLEAMEYIQRHNGRQGRLGEYELHCDATASLDGFQVGLIDVTKLRPAKSA